MTSLRSTCTAGARLGGGQRGQSPARDQRSCPGAGDGSAHPEPGTGMQEPRAPGGPALHQRLLVLVPGRRAFGGAGSCAQGGSSPANPQVLVAPLPPRRVRGDALDPGLPWLPSIRSQGLVPRMSLHVPITGWPRPGATSHHGSGRRVGAQCPHWQRVPSGFLQPPPQPVPPGVDSVGHILARAPCQPTGPCPPPAGPVASAAPAPPRRWQGHPVQQRATRVDTATPLPQHGALGPVSSAPPVPAPASAYGASGQRLGQLQPPSGLGDTCWQGQGGDSSESL